MDDRRCTLRNFLSFSHWNWQVCAAVDGKHTRMRSARCCSGLITDRRRRELGIVTGVTPAFSEVSAMFCARQGWRTAPKCSALRPDVRSACRPCDVHAGCVARATSAQRSLHEVRIFRQYYERKSLHVHTHTQTVVHLHHLKR